MTEVRFQSIPNRTFTSRVIATDTAAVIGYLRCAADGYFIARSVGSAMEAADIRRFKTQESAASWLARTGQRRVA